MPSPLHPRPPLAALIPSRRATTSLLFLSLLLLFFLLHPHYQLPQSPRDGAFSTSKNTTTDFHHLFLSSDASSNSTISSHLRALTLRPHLAGTPSSLTAAHYVLTHLRLVGLQTLTRDYEPLLSYPVHSSLSLHFPSPATTKPLSLSEPGHDDQMGVVKPYHAYSPSGSALAPPVYANYGRDEDYQKLIELGVEVAGSIVIVRSGDVYRGAVVKRAEEYGAVAVLIFKEYGDGDDGKVGKGGVERGTVLIGGPGDPLTPGWATGDGRGGAERFGMDDEEVKRRFPKIPSLPVPTVTAEEILRTLGGPRMPEEWRGRLQLDESSGAGRGPTLLNFTYKGDRKLGRIQNVFGVIKGREEPDRYVILGNHRDAWTYGAVDPNSGTATLLDVARRFGVLLRAGWRPRRTIILCSWDAEEFGMIGSTEWVEQNLGILGSKAVVYLNVDCAVQGPGFIASATPQLDKLLLEVTKEVKDPDSEGMTVFQTWEVANNGTNIERLGRADSDFSAFLHLAGIPSIDMYFGKDFPVYHTVFDSYDWMNKYGDPLFHRHVAVAGVWGLLALRLADDPILPFDYLSYAAQLQEHSNALHTLLDGGRYLQAINVSVLKFTYSAKKAQDQAEKLLDQQSMEGSADLRRRAFNDRLMLAERSFLEVGGLEGRPWFKHMIYAPTEDYESRISFFPGIVDSISRAKKVVKGGELSIQHEIWKVARAIQRAAHTLDGELP